MNHSVEIYEYIREHPGADVQEIADATGWIRHVVEMATKMMLERNLIREVGLSEWNDPKYEVSPPNSYMQLMPAASTSRL